MADAAETDKHLLGQNRTLARLSVCTHLCTNICYQKLYVVSVSRCTGKVYV